MAPELSASRMALVAQATSSAAPIDAATALIKSLGEDTAVLCSHGDVVPALLSALAPHTYRGLDELPIAKGSTWVVDHHRDKATYLEPPSGKGK